MATIYGALRTNSTMSNAQTTYGGVGTSFEINAYSSLTYNDGASTTVMDGDSITNEQPNDPTQTLAGNAIGWDYTIEVTDGTNIYQIGIIDYDINGDGDYDYPTAEQGYFLGFIGSIPPLNTTLTINGIINNSVSIPISSFVPCFVSGTEIMTPMGPTIIENLTVGDSVLTANRGPQTIRWIGKRQITLDELTKNPKLRPVRIMASALGLGLPKRDLLISRQHRMLAQSKIAERMLGEAEVLVPAIKLTELPGIFVDEAVEEVEYFHLLFDQHEVIYAEGAPTESLFTGPEALKAISPEAREEILTIFPEVADLNYVPEPARFIPSGKLQKKLVERHLKNERPLLA
jgi:hypothetical protein